MAKRRSAESGDRHKERPATGKATPTLSEVLPVMRVVEHPGEFSPDPKPADRPQRKDD